MHLIYACADIAVLRNSPYLSECYLNEQIADSLYVHQYCYYYDRVKILHAISKESISKVFKFKMHLASGAILMNQRGL